MADVRIECTTCRVTKPSYNFKELPNGKFGKVCQRCKDKKDPNHVEIRAIAHNIIHARGNGYGAPAIERKK